MNKTSTERSLSFTLGFMLLLAALISISCAKPFERKMRDHVSQLKLDDWHELTSPDFVLYARGPTESLETFALDLARYIAVVERLVGGQPPKTPARLVFVTENAENLFIPYRGLAAYISPSLAGFHAFVKGTGYDPVLRSVLLHEFTHYLNLRNTRLTYPVWYQEGFAEFLGPIRTRGDTMEIGSRPPWRLDALENRRRRKEAFDLEEIFSFKKTGSFRYPNDFYAISWVTVHYLNASPERQKRLIKMLELQSSGLDWRKAYSGSFSESLEDLTQKVELHAEHLRQGMPAAVLYLPLKVLSVRSEWAIREVPPQEMLQILGKITAHHFTIRDFNFTQALSLALLNRSLEFNAEDPMTQAGLAAAHSGLAHFQKAEEHLEAFEKVSTPPAHALFDAGLAKERHADNLYKEADERTTESAVLYEQAAHLFHRALAIEPNNPLVLAGLGRYQLAKSEFDQARKYLAKAQDFGEWDADLTFSRAQVEDREGMPGAAISFWNEIILLGNEEQAKKAKALLKAAYAFKPKSDRDSK